MARSTKGVRMNDTTVPQAFRGMINGEQDELAPAEIVVTHRLEFRASRRGENLPWLASMIEDVRRKLKIPDEADLKVSKKQVVFTWWHPWAEPMKARRRKA